MTFFKDFTGDTYLADNIYQAFTMSLYEMLLVLEKRADEIREVTYDEFQDWLKLKERLSS